jgi:hypothetical protein
MCGVKFIVLEDGTTNEIRAISVSVNCQCGRPYTISALQFPRKIHCLDCHHCFSVLDTGEIIDANIDLESAAKLDSTAIQASGPSEWKAPVVTAIREELPCDLAPPHTVAPVLNKDRRDDFFNFQLAAFDDKWQQQRIRYLIAIHHWLYFYPTRLICVGLFAAYVPIAVVGALIFFDLFNLPTSATWWVLLILVNGSIFFFAHLFQRAALYDAAETRWQMERDAMIREYQSKRSYRPTDSDESAY